MIIHLEKGIALPAGVFIASSSSFSTGGVTIVWSLISPKWACGAEDMAGVFYTTLETFCEACG